MWGGVGRVRALVEGGAVYHGHVARATTVWGRARLQRIDRRHHRRVLRYVRYEGRYYPPLADLCVVMGAGHHDGLDVDALVGPAGQRGRDSALRMDALDLHVPWCQALRQQRLVLVGAPRLRRHGASHLAVAAEQPHLVTLVLGECRYACPICDRSAASSIGGKGLPLLLARLSIPWHALGLKEYRRSRSDPPPASSTSDKKDTAASLGHSEELSVQNSPRQPIPEFIHLPEEGSKGSSPVL